MNTLQEKSQQLENRTLDFTVDVISLCKTLPTTLENKITSAQLIRSASSIGANYAEANNAASKLDFRNKIFIAKKEAAETRYWLKVIAKTNEGIKTEPLIEEATQLLLILQKIISTLKNGK